MVQRAHSQERFDQLRRRVVGSVVVAGLLVLVTAVAFGVVAWGWLRTVGVLYAVSIVLVIPLAATDKWVARRTAREADGR